MRGFFLFTKKVKYTLILTRDFLQQQEVIKINDVMDTFDAKDQLIMQLQQQQQQQQQLIENLQRQITTLQYQISNLSNIKKRYVHNILCTLAPSPPFDGADRLSFQIFSNHDYQLTNRFDIIQTLYYYGFNESSKQLIASGVIQTSPNNLGDRPSWIVYGVYSNNSNLIIKCHNKTNINTYNHNSSLTNWNIYDYVVDLCSLIR